MPTTQLLTIYDAFIISHDDINCTIISELDSKTYIIPLIDGILPVGLTIVNSNLNCNIFQVPIIGKKLLTACKSFKYDYNRNKKDYQTNKLKISLKNKLQLSLKKSLNSTTAI